MSDYNITIQNDSSPISIAIHNENIPITEANFTLPSTGENGNNGWSPVVRITNEVLEVYDWVGGTGIKPDVLGYIGSTGIVSNIDDAYIVKGSNGKDANILSIDVIYTATGSLPNATVANSELGSTITLELPSPPKGDKGEAGKDGLSGLPKTKLNTLLPAISTPITNLHSNDTYYKNGELLNILPDINKVILIGSSSISRMNTYLSNGINQINSNTSTYLAGFPGATMEQLEMMTGSKPLRVTLPNNTLNATGSTLLSSVDNMRQSTYFANVTGWIKGVHGSLRVYGNTISFNITTPRNSPLLVDGVVEFVPEKGNEYRNAIAIIWGGKNNITSTLETINDIDNIIEQTDSIIDHMGSLVKRCVIMTHYVDRDVADDSIDYDRIKQCNDLYKLRYPNNVFDAEAIILNPAIFTDLSITRTSADALAQQKGKLAPSLAADSLHCTPQVYNYINAKLMEYIVNKGYLTEEVSTTPPIDPDPPIEVVPGKQPVSNPRILLDARQLIGTQGSIVSDWVGEGKGLISERTFNQVREGADWTYPTYDVSEKASIYFNSRSLIANNNITDTIVSNASYVVVAKLVGNYSITDGRWRLFTGDVANGFHGFYPTNGMFAMGAGLRNEVQITPLILNKWFIAVVVYNGNQSKLLLSDNVGIRNVNGVGTSNQSRLTLGGNINYVSHADKGMTGNLSVFAQYDKVFTDEEMLQTLDYYKEQFNI